MHSASVILTWMSKSPEMKAFLREMCQGNTIHEEMNGGGGGQREDETLLLSLKPVTDCSR